MNKYGAHKELGKGLALFWRPESLENTIYIGLFGAPLFFGKAHLASCCALNLRYC